jgi:hypothetical protein
MRTIYVYVYAFAMVTKELRKSNFDSIIVKRAKKKRSLRQSM